MSDKPPDNNNGLLELFKKLWLPLAGFIGAITLVYNYYKLWLGDQAAVTVITASIGLAALVIALVWIGFKINTITRDAVWPIGAKITEEIPAYSPQYRKTSRIILVVIFIGMIIGGGSLVRHRQGLEEKLVVLIAAFEGPEEVYGLRNEIIENLNADFSADKDIEIVVIDDVITLIQGSEYATKLGERYLADIVIWGWYRPTENPNITIHIENLTPEKTLPIRESTTLQPAVTLAELESFTFQQLAGQETSALISFLAGFTDYSADNYETAIDRFDHALENISASSRLLESWAEIYFYRANANIFAGNAERAIQDYDKAIQIDPQLAVAYNNRGNAYDELGEYQLAIQDYDKAIQIDPQLAVAYYNRGLADADLGEYQLAIQDYDQAIQIDPQYAMAYNNRGNAYYELGEYQLAIQDYDKAIQIDPQSAKAYYNRGLAYVNLGEYQLAIQDYDQAIQIDPQLAVAYNNRGVAYADLGEHQRAIQDYDQAIQIDPQLAVAYNNRGVAYQKLGKTAEAEADFKKYEELTGHKP